MRSPPSTRPGDARGRQSFAFVREGHAPPDARRAVPSPSPVTLARQHGMRSPQVFISYSSKDRNHAEELHDAFVRAGLRVWRDKTRLESDWSREIAYALANDADAVCLLWSPHAADSAWVRNEWLTA